MATPGQTVYVFISSTFNDMRAERDHLVKQVFPQLREWCEERRLPKGLNGSLALPWPAGG